MAACEKWRKGYPCDNFFVVILSVFLKKKHKNLNETVYLKPRCSALQYSNFLCNLLWVRPWLKKKLVQGHLWIPLNAHNLCLERN